MKRLMTSVCMAVLGLGLVLAQTATAQERTAENQGQQFVRKAATGGLAEVQLGQMALQRAASPEVKQFAQQMVDDHTKANNELRQITPGIVLMRLGDKSRCFEHKIFSHLG